MSPQLRLCGFRRIEFSVDAEVRRRREIEELLELGHEMYLAPALENVATALRAVEEPRATDGRPDVATQEQSNLLSLERARQVVENVRPAPLVADRADGVALLGRSDDCLGILLRSSNRLLEVDVDPARERGHRCLSVRERWRADPDRVGPLPREELLPPLVDTRSGRRNVLGATRVDVADGDHLCISTRRQHFEVASGDPACAEEPHAKRRVHRITLLRSGHAD